MSLHVPSSFRLDDPARVLALLAAHPFATLITAIDGQDPWVSYLPLLVEGQTLVGHLARANPHAQQLEQGRTLALFLGPHAYVSPRWYTEPTLQVPTWNYAAVQAGGPIELLDVAQARQALVALSAHFDPGFTLSPTRVDQLLGGIVAFRLRIERLEAKDKMNQNKSPADREGVIAGLRATGLPGDAAVADWMQTRD